MDRLRRALARHLRTLAYRVDAPPRTIAVRIPDMPTDLDALADLARLANITRTTTPAEWMTRDGA